MTDIASTTDISRRNFMIGAGGLSFAIVSGAGTAQAAGPLAFSHWVTLAPDGRVTIKAAAAELGQGTRTYQPLVLAEEMDADWKMVRIESAPPDDKLYGNPGVGGIMYTNAARTMSGYFPLMRTFGAQARRALISAVAQKWNVPPEELSTEPGRVIHAKSKRTISYGDIAKFATLPANAPEIKPEDLKKPENFRYLGKNVMRIDVPSKTRGEARYGIDVRLPKMLYGAVLRSPVQGGGPQSVDDVAARKVPGVRDVVRLPYGVGILATSPVAAMRAKDVLKVEWNREGKARGYNSEKMVETYLAAARDMSVSGMQNEKAGEAREALAKAASVVTAEYVCDHAYHAQMEPLTAVASVAADGQSAEIWLGTQGQTIATDSAARTLGIAQDKIKLNDMMVGGAYGRRGHREHEFVTDALLLSKASGVPVKVTWTREDDIHNGRFRPLTTHLLRAGFDASGKITAWDHRVSADLVFAFQDPVRYERANKRDGMVVGGSDAAVFDIPNRFSEVIVHDNGVRTSSLRGIGNGPNKFAIDSFMDELARKANADPVAFRLNLVPKNERARKVIQQTASAAGWGTVAAGRAKGFSFIEYGGTLLGAVAEISLDKASGKINVHKIWCTVDPGFVIQPDNVTAQIEGGIIYGLGLALTEQITIEDGVVQQSNFYDYVVPRMRDIPEINVALISNPALPPTGVGEQVVPLVAPVIGNAFAALTGVRLRRIPLTPERVMKALSA